MSSDLVDNDQISGHKPDISVKNGYSFTNFVRGIALVFVLFGLAITTSFTLPTILIGTVIILSALFIFSSEYGTDISTSTMYIREYHKRFFFLKTGPKWIPMSPFSDVCILKLGKSRQVSDMYGVSSNSLDASKNEVYLMTYDHRRRFLVKICNSKQEAIEFAQEFAEKFDKTVKEFNPAISEATRRRVASRR